MSESIANRIHSDTDALVARINTLLPASDGISAADTHQFIVGFVHMMEQAARGNMEPRDEYREAVIPAIRAGGMPAGPVMSGMVCVGMGVAAFYASNDEVLRWTTNFCSEHTLVLAATYSA
jgi:hypothetical protein